MRISDWSSDVCSSDLNKTKFTVPERRVIQYALFDSAAVPVPAVTDAEIAKVYKDNAAQYAASETPRFAQVILPDTAAAQAPAATVTGGTSPAPAAQAPAPPADAPPTQTTTTTCRTPPTNG